MNISQAQLAAEVETARANGWIPLMRRAEKRHKLPQGLLLAIASRETDMRDIVGDVGHGRGLFQIDDRFHTEWLAEHGAGSPGTVPPIVAAADLAGSMLASNMTFGSGEGVGAGEVLRFGCSAYNAGAGNAIKGFREGDCDRRTTGKDYGRDVLERLAAVQGLTGIDMSGNVVVGPPVPSPDAPGPILAIGSRNTGVRQLKQDLQAWFERATPGEWADFAISPGPTFGTPLDRAVREFQGRIGLFVDGQVGDDTRGALADLAPPARSVAAAGFPDLHLNAPLKRGSTAGQVKLVQGWLTLHGFKLPISGSFGPATEAQVNAFQTSRSLPATGIVEAKTYRALVQPMLSALLPLAGGIPLGALFVAYARQHLAQHPLEVGGDNCGPWVRLYTGGQEGANVPWCAGFATFCLQQAATTLDVAMPVPSTLSCDTIAATAGNSFLGRPTPTQRKRITPGSFFLRPAKPGTGMKYAHCGIVTHVGADTFATIEGNTNDTDSTRGFEVCARVHGYAGLDFVLVR
ncbi:MAG TPA: peptidoglycan-binding protein [Gaiellaceae bacterium]